jgi:acyl-CoA synthetase (AMP-forming)/AMP-acid ligase II
MSPTLGSLTDVLDDRARRQPADPAYTGLSSGTTETGNLSFAQLHHAAYALAEVLKDRVAPGDRVLLVFATGLECVVAFFACLVCGAVAVPIMPPRRKSGSDSHAAIMADCEPTLALTIPGMEAPYPGLPQLAVDLRHLATLPVTGTRARARPGDIAFIQYTSGSTSTPKGVVVSHGNLLANLEAIRITFGANRDTTHVTWLPLHHDMGLIMSVLECAYVGARCVLMPPSGFMYRPLEWLRAIHHYRATISAAPNFAYDLCVDRLRPGSIENLDLRSWRVAINAAEPVRAETMSRFAAAFAPYGFDGRAFRPAYGLAEATVFISSTQTDQKPDDRERVSCGLTVPCHEAVIVDPLAHRRLPAGEIGEVWLRGPSIAQGYWRRPEETAATFQADIDGSRWLRTGDLGCLDEDGRLYIAGRLKDVIIVRGCNHYPQDIERTVALSHPALRRDYCAAFTVPNDRGEEQLVIVQELARGLVDHETIRHAKAAIRAAVVDGHDLTVFAISLIRTGTLPKTTSGKVQRSLTRTLWLGGALEDWQPHELTNGAFQPA